MLKKKGNDIMVFSMAIFTWILSPLMFEYMGKNETIEEKESVQKSLNFEIICMAVLFAIWLIQIILPIASYLFYILLIIHTVINILAVLAVNNGKTPNMYVPLDIIKR